MTRSFTVFVLCLASTLAVAAPPSGSPPGLEKVCEAKLPPPPFPVVASDAFKASLYTAPCDLTAERGVCLFDQATLSLGQQAALTLVPVERAPGARSGVLYVGSVTPFVDDWQGETALITVDDQVVAKGAVPGKSISFTTELVAPGTPDGAWTVVTTIGGVKVARKVDPKATPKVDYNRALVSCGWTRDSGGSGTVFQLVAGSGDTGTATTVVATVRVVFQNSGQ